MRKTVCKNIEKIVTKSGNSYRCRLRINGTNYEHYETNLTRAKSWIKTLKTVKT